MKKKPQVIRLLLGEDEVFTLKYFADLFDISRQRAHQIFSDKGIESVAMIGRTRYYKKRDIEKAIKEKNEAKQRTEKRKELRRQMEELQGNY